MPPLTPVVKKLVIINVVVFALMFLMDNVIGDLWGISDYLALYYPTSEKFHPIQLVTHFFVHGGLGHIFFNMFGLVMFGPLLEHRYGPGRFLFLYLCAAAGAVMLHFGFTWYQIGQYEELLAVFQNEQSLGAFSQFFSGVPIEDLRLDTGERVAAVVENIESNIALRENVDKAVSDGVVMMQEYIDYQQSIPIVGASGAIYGIVGAFAILYPDFKLMLIFLPVPIKARYFVPILLAVEVFLGIMQYSWDPIAHFAHIGGALTGAALAYYWYRADPPAGTTRWN